MTTYDAAAFGADLLEAANGALPFIGGGVAGGLVILALTLGIRKGLSALRTVGK